MEVTSSPFFSSFEDDGYAAVVRIGRIESRTVIILTLLLPQLDRSGREDDSSVELCLNGSWEKHYLRKAKVLENSSRRARVRLKIEKEGEVRSFHLRFGTIAV